jgi:hypothetical protein
MTLQKKLARRTTKTLSAARSAIADLGSNGVRMLKKHPVRSVVGALAAGLAITKVARRA